MAHGGGRRAYKKCSPSPAIPLPLSAASASPDAVLIVHDLPKTRSGKIMRRMLRKVAAGESAETMGDQSTLADPAVLTALIAARKALGDVGQ